MHNVHIKGDRYEIRGLVPSDFFKDVFPSVSHFVPDKKTSGGGDFNSKKALERLSGCNDSETESKEQIEAAKSILKSCVISRNSIPFDVDSFFATETDLSVCVDLIQKIIEISCNYRTITEITANYASVIHKLARTYGKLPHQIVFGETATILDAYTFNLCVFMVAYPDELKKMAKDGPQIVYQV